MKEILKDAKWNYVEFTITFKGKKFKLPKQLFFLMAEAWTEPLEF